MFLGIFFTIRWTLIIFQYQPIRKILGYQLVHSHTHYIVGVSLDSLALIEGTKKEFATGVVGAQQGGLLVCFQRQNTKCQRLPYHAYMSYKYKYICKYKYKNKYKRRRLSIFLTPLLWSTRIFGITKKIGQKVLPKGKCSWFTNCESNPSFHCCFYASVFFVLVFASVFVFFCVFVCLVSPLWIK